MTSGFFYRLSLVVILSGLSLQQCSSKKAEKRFVLDDIEYEFKDGGVGYRVQENNSLDLNTTSFVTLLHITNRSGKVIRMDSSNFILTGENKGPFHLKTQMNDSDVSAMYNQEIRPGEATDLFLTFDVPGEGKYDLHLLSPLSKTEKVIRY